MKKTIVEAGHYYQVHGPSKLSIKGWEIGKEYAASQPDAALVLFVDDYHMEQPFLEPGDAFLGPQQAAHASQTMLKEANHIFSEAALAEIAPQTMTKLLENGLVKLKKGELSAGGVRLGRLRRL